MGTAIIDYGMCNLDSVMRALEECGGRPFLATKPAQLKDSSSIILPGVGSFSDGMKNIREAGLDIAIREQVVERGVPMLGICLGMQLLAEKGTEGGDTAGLGLIQGKVLRLRPDSPDEKIPHIGWNEVNLCKESAIFKDLPSGRDFYFVHSYNLVCSDSRDILAMTPYCGGFISAVERENVRGVQFHPEKSLKVGLRLLSNFLAL